ncbi:hypothetical protein ACTFIW_007016 [Dictyostelium discoideum]
MIITAMNKCGTLVETSVNGSLKICSTLFNFGDIHHANEWNTTLEWIQSGGDHNFFFIYVMMKNIYPGGIDVRMLVKLVIDSDQFNFIFFITINKYNNYY